MKQSLSEKKFAKTISAVARLNSIWIFHIVDATNVVKKNAYVNKQNARLLPQLPHKWQTMPPRNRAQHVSKCCQWTCFVVKKAERPNSVKCAVTTTRSKMNSATASIATHWHVSLSLNRFAGTENEKQGRERQQRKKLIHYKQFRLSKFIHKSIICHASGNRLVQRPVTNIKLARVRVMCIVRTTFDFLTSFSQTTTPTS